MAQQDFCKTFIQLVASGNTSEWKEVPEHKLKFNHEQFIVDNVLIAKAVKNKNDKICMLIAEQLMGSHLDSFSAYVKAYCPFQNYAVYEIPQGYPGSQYNNDFGSNGVSRVIAIKLRSNEEYIENKNCAQDIIKYYNLLEKLNASIFDFQEVLNSFKELYDRAVESTSALEKLVNDFIKENDYGTLTEIAFFGAHCDLVETVPGFKRLLKDKLNLSGNLSFLHVDENIIYSNERDENGNPKAVMTLDEGLRIGDNMQLKKFKHGQTYGDYKVMGVRPDTIQMGCNYYDRRMFDYIYDRMIEIRGHKPPKKKGRKRKDSDESTD